MYKVDVFTVLHSGHSLPGSGNALQHGEGVGIVFDPVMTQAWHDARESWSAVNSRIVSIHLQLNNNIPSSSQHLFPLLMYMHQPIKL